MIIDNELVEKLAQALYEKEYEMSMFHWELRSENYKAIWRDKAKTLISVLESLNLNVVEK